MASYFIKKNKPSKTIIVKSMEFDSSYKITPKMKDNAKIKITEINIIDKNIIDDIVTKKILSNYQKIFKKVYLYTNDDESTDNELYSLNAVVNKKIIINQMNRNIPYPDMEYEEEKNRTL